MGGLRLPVIVRIVKRALTYGQLLNRSHSCVSSSLVRDKRTSDEFHSNYCCKIFEELIAQIGLHEVRRCSSDRGLQEKSFFFGTNNATSKECLKINKEDSEENLEFLLDGDFS